MSLGAPLKCNLTTTITYGSGASGWLAVSTETHSTATLWWLTVSPQPNDLAAGVYSASVHLSCPGDARFPAESTVNLTVNPP